MPDCQRGYTSSLNEWQRLAYEWCVANPLRMLVLTSTKPRLIYHIAKRGEYVEFGLPTTATAVRSVGSDAMARLDCCSMSIEHSMRQFPDSP
jgi:hypothetical protein